MEGPIGEEWGECGRDWGKAVGIDVDVVEEVELVN